MTQDSESRSLDKVIVRLPDGMRERLKAAAEISKRSMNAEIVARLEVTLKSDESFGESFAKKEVDRIVNLTASKAAMEAIDAVLAMLALPDGTPNSERFQAMVRKNSDLSASPKKDDAPAKTKSTP